MASAEKFEAMNVFDQRKAVHLLELEKENHQKMKPIYDAVKKTSCEVVDIITLGSYHIVEVYSKHEKEKQYTAFVDMKPTHNYVYTLQEAIIQAMLVDKYGINTGVHALQAIAPMFSKNESEQER